MSQLVKLVGYGVDTLILNVRYSDSLFTPIKQELDETLQKELDYLQASARQDENAVASDWSFNGALLFVEPHGAGKQWRWLLTCRWLSLVVSRGKFNDVIAQVRFSSEFLWSRKYTGDALYEVHTFLMSIFGQYIHLQVSEVHLCADVTGYDFAQSDYEHAFVSRVRKNQALYEVGVDRVALEHRRVSMLTFSSPAAPLSCVMYNKPLEIKQKSMKTWFYDLWRTGVDAPGGGRWDGESDVWRVEFRFKRDFLHNLSSPIEQAYDVLGQFKPLWDYAAGHKEGGDDGLPDGWLRYVVPDGDDTNRSRWSVHPAWSVVQSAFSIDLEPNVAAIVRERIREKNIERGIASTIGYISTLAAWLGGEHTSPESDLSLTLRWLYSSGNEYLEEKQRDFLNEVRKKQARYGSTDAA